MTEEDLERLVIKYGDGLRSRRFAPLAEREADRSGLADNDLHHASPRAQKVDSHVYCLLARTHDEAARQLLLNDTTPIQRMAMIAEITRRCFYPLIGLIGPAICCLPPTMRRRAEAEAAVDGDTIAHAATLTAPPPGPPAVRRVHTTREQLADMERRVDVLLSGTPRLEDLSGLDLLDAQIVSRKLAGGRFMLAGGKLVAAPSPPGRTTRRRCLVLANHRPEDADRATRDLHA